MRDSRRWWALGALNLAVLAVSLDGTILSVALPTLAHALDAGESDLQWFSSGYLLVLAAAMLPAGLLGDRYGRKKVLLGSVALFGAGSALCAAAPSSGAFIAARTLLGLAGAGVIVMALSALTVLFSEEERPKAVGVWSAANFVALPLGPILGGWLLSEFWWGWVFLINVPVALVGLLAAWRLVPESRPPVRPGFDAVGLAASVTGLVALTYGMIEAGEHGWGSPGALLPIFAGIAVLVGFVFWERRVPEPLIDPALFRSHAYTWGVVLVTVAILAMIGVLFTMPQYFQGVRGTDAMGSGIRLLPLIGGLVLGALPADRLAARVGAKATVAIGFLVLAGGLLLGATTRLGSSEGFVALWMAVTGVGMGLTTATATSAALSELPEERSGVGSAVLQACNKTGGPLGTAILGSVLSSAYLARLHGVPAAARESVFGGVAAAQSAAQIVTVRGAFVHGMNAALLVSAAIALAGAVVALAFLPARRAVLAAAG
jgi:EmrB/QacA subfamily drug resistance transporter